jgi:NADH dehydrogenase
MHVVIVGGGFAGVYAAKHLLGYGAKVTLISKTNYFLFTPLLHEVAVGSVNRHNICTPIRTMFYEKDFRFIRSEAEKIDLKKKTVSIDGLKIPFDKLIMAAGCRSNHYNIPGAEEHTLSLKTLRDAISIRDRLISVLESIAVKPKPLSLVVVGAGPTGVELCGDLCDLIEENLKYRYPELKGLKHEVYLIQSTETILPMLHEKTRKIASGVLEKSGIKILLSSRVAEVGKDYVMAGDKKIKADIIIWSGGIKPPQLNIIPNLQDEKGYINVDENMAARGYDDVYALGDITGTPQLAQAAIEQSKTVAKNIMGRKKPFRFHNKGLIVSLGHRKAVGEVYLFGKTIVVRGKLAWYMKRMIYLMNLIGIKNKIQVGIEWFFNLLFGRDISEI